MKWCIGCELAGDTVAGTGGCHGGGALPTAGGGEGADGEHYQLQAVVKMPTEMSLHRVISGWRKRQAEELLQAGLAGEDNTPYRSGTKRRTRPKVMRKLDEEARRCGWASAKAMKRYLNR